MAGASLGRPALYWHFPAYLQGYTARHGAFRTTPAAAIRMGDWKLIEYLDGTGDDFAEIIATEAKTVVVAESGRPGRPELLAKRHASWASTVVFSD